MIRNLRTLGLALVAVFAMSAMAASAAQAEEAKFAAAEYPAFINAVGESNQEFETSIGTLNCGNVTGSSVLAEETNTMTGENIKYSECTASSIFPVTVDMNGCHYTFDAGESTGEGEAEGSVKIEGCNEEGGVTIRIYAFGSTDPHPTKDLLCEIHVPEQTPTSRTVHYKPVIDNGKEATTVQATNVKVHATITGTEQNETHPNYICEHATDTNAVYNGEFIATAENEEEEAIDTTMTP